MKNNYHHIDYQYVHLNFNWTWIRDKSGLKLGDTTKDYWIVDFKPEIKKEEE